MRSNRSSWLFRQVRERYEHPLEVNAYSEQVVSGLTAEEEAVLRQHLPDSCRILDIGCGAGREAITLAGRGHKVVAADISRSMLRAARRFAAENGVNIACVWMPDPLKLPVPNAAFDSALGLAQLLSHIPSRDGRIQFLGEVRRALVPGGLFIGTITERGSAADLLGSADLEPSALEKAAGWEEGDIWVWQPSQAELDTPLYFHLHTAEELESELSSAGLELVACTPGDRLLANEQGAQGAQGAPDTPGASDTLDAQHEAGRYWYVVARRIK